MKKEISILGCGWLGLPLAKSLIYDGFVVKGSVRTPEKMEMLNSAGIIPFLLDLNQPNNSLKEFLMSEILIICIPSKNIEQYKNLISNIENSPVKKVLFVSSTSVYDNINSTVTEETTVNNSALSTIELMFKAADKFQTTIIRFGGLFGYDRKPSNFFKEGAVIDNPEGFVNMIHQDECISIVTQLIKKDYWNQTFNACADSHPSRRDFYTNEAKKDGKLIPVFNENASNDFKIVSSEKIKAFLNFRFQYGNLLD